MYRCSHENWLGDFRARRPEVSMDAIEKLFYSLWRVQPDFLYSAPREFIKNCRAPILVVPDDTPSHPLQTSIDVGIDYSPVFALDTQRSGGHSDIVGA